MATPQRKKYGSKRPIQGLRRRQRGAPAAARKAPRKSIRSAVPVPTVKSAAEGVRINRYLAGKGYATRRGADALIEAKKVRINGRVAVLGDKVATGDVVEVAGGDVLRAHIYALYHKPKGVITHSPAPGEKDIAAMLKGVSALAGLFPVGRLDKASSGLLLLTNDGRITDRLLNPTHEHEREYEVTVDKRISKFAMDKMERGVRIESYTTKPAKVARRGNNTFSITLTEGKKHQIRRMCAALGYSVVDLRRTRIMNLRLGTLKPNGWRTLEGSELATFLASIGL